MSLVGLSSSLRLDMASASARVARTDAGARLKVERDDAVAAGDGNDAHGASERRAPPDESDTPSRRSRDRARVETRRTRRGRAEECRASLFAGRRVYPFFPGNQIRANRRGCSTAPRARSTVCEPSITGTGTPDGRSTGAHHDDVHIFKTRPRASTTRGAVPHPRRVSPLLSPLTLPPPRRARGARRARRARRP